MLMLSVTGGGRKTGILRQRSERLGRRGLLCRDAGLQGGLLVQLRRRRNVGEVAVLAVGLHAAAQTLAARSFASGALTRDPNPLQAVAGHIVLLVGHDATLHVESIPFGLFPIPCPSTMDFLCAFIGAVNIYMRPLRHSVKRTDRKCCCDFRLIR
ncbi:Glycosyl transferase group 2 [Sarracenia purpurea var. burkii]